jgi:hypothetical protein
MRCLVQLLVAHFRKSGNGLTETGHFQGWVCIFRSGVMAGGHQQFTFVGQRPGPIFEAMKASLVNAIQAQWRIASA